MKKIITLSICFISCLFCQAQMTIFVNKNASGGQQNGSGWQNAFPDLQQALAVAGSGDEIWVVAGTYYPTATTDRAVSFVLKQGVRMYGGFNGTETTLDQRNYELNETILSGNIGTSNGSDNSYHVLYGTGIDSTTVLDGFTVTRGGAPGAGLPVSNSRGGGLYLEPSPGLANTRPVIQNCRFELNSAATGGAIFCSYDFGNTVNPILRNCRFVSNRASLFAGALYKGGPATAGQPFIIESCHFIKNAALASEGGGVYLANTGNTTIFRECTFEKDSAFASWGAGLFYASSADSKLVLDSCDFIENYGSEGAGFTFQDFTFSGALFSCEMDHCKFDGNKTRNGDAAAILLLGFTKSRIKADIVNTAFVNNLTYTNMTNFVQGGSNSDISLNVERCIFKNNIDWNNPNGLCFALLAGTGSGESNGRVNIANCLFADNGGGIAVLNGNGSKLRTDITNCTFYSNNKFIIDKSWYPEFDTSNVYGNDCYITNCAFWEPNSAYNQIFTNNDYANVNMYNYHINHCMVGLPNVNIPGSAEAFGDNVIFGTYPMFSDTANDDFRLLPCSPAVNKGNNIVVDSLGLDTDLDGYSRIYRDTVDLGAYEVQDTCLVVGNVEPFQKSDIILATPNPVPAGQPFSIRVPEYLAGTIIWRMTDASGRQWTSGVISSSDLSSNILSPIEPGLYFLQLRSDNKQAQCKVVVHKQQ